ncbi:MAG TPA: gliding motility-associated C-terminal domain-containing protein, partial [Flavipsychrobacter sp.]|nr:gliding motility-associated C-terminal domain-containing protein [Flavipsychrobacter sp.]
SGNNGDTAIAWPGENTSYYVAITSSVCDYKDTLTALVEVRDVPDVKIVKAESISCENPGGLLEATGALNYVWTPAATLTGDSSATPFSTTTVPTWYTVKGIDAYGCTGYDKALLGVAEIDLSDMFVPSVFSPNGDGKNDCYRIVLPANATDYELHIYNRSGNNIYNADSGDDCWDGTYKGEPCDVGVYNYYYTIRSVACKRLKKRSGTITLVR